MILTLHLAAGAGSPDEVRTLEHGTMTIGRGPENAWALADPDRTISKQHCRIDRSDDGFLLTDTSTNGVFLNTEVQPLGRGHSHALVNGDVIIVGPFRMTASLAEPPMAVPYEPATVLPLVPDPAPAYSGVVHTQGSPILPPQEEPWLQAIPGGKFGPGLRAGPQGWEAPPDPDDYSATGHRPAEPNPLDAGPMEFSQASEHSEAISAVMRLPPAQAVLPTDWNDADPLDGAELAMLPVDAALARSAPAGLHDVRLPVHEAREAWGVVAPATPAYEPEPAAMPAPAPVAVPAEPDLPPAGLASDPRSAAPQANRLTAAFLAGAGLPADALGDLAPEASFQQMGEMVRAAVEGVREILATRAMVKSELRADHTVIQAADNNAMKFAPDVQRCLAAMVGQPPPGFLPGPEAMRRSMEDIKRHELALVAALNTVFAEMTAQLDPEAIGLSVRSEPGISSMIPYAREARCWALFAERFAALQNSGAQNTGGSLLAPVAAAYAKHIRRGA